MQMSKGQGCGCLGFLGFPGHRLPWEGDEMNPVEGARDPRNPGQIPSSTAASFSVSSGRADGRSGFYTCVLAKLSGPGGGQGGPISP